MRLTHPTRHNLRRVRRPHPLRDLTALLPLHHGNVVLALQIEPELRTVAEITAEPHRRIGGDGAPSVQDIRDTARRCRATAGSRTACARQVRA